MWYIFLCRSCVASESKPNHTDELCVLNSDQSATFNTSDAEAISTNNPLFQREGVQEEQEVEAKEGSAINNQIDQLVCGEKESKIPDKKGRKDPEGQASHHA